MDKIIKYFTTKAEKVDKRVLRFIGSDEGIDRDGDQIMLDGWDLKEYKENPVVLFGHRYSEEPVARTKRVWANQTEKRLMFDIEFPESEISSKGDSLYRLYKSGFMQATSVGFLPDFKKVEYPENKSGKGPYRIYKGQKLLEISLVSVGSNSRALLTSKSMNEAIKANVIDQLELDELLMYFEEEKKIEEKPYEGFHSCRLNDPKQYDKFARKNCEIKHDGKCIDVIYGIKGKKSEIQALRFKTDIWTETQVKNYCKDKEGMFEAAKKTIQTSSEVIDKEDIQTYKTELDEAETKIMELELQLSEQKMNEEIEEDDLYTELFEEFSLAASDGKSADGKQTEELIDDLKNIRKENNNGK